MWNLAILLRVCCCCCWRSELLKLLLRFKSFVIFLLRLIIAARLLVLVYCCFWSWKVRLLFEGIFCSFEKGADYYSRTISSDMKKTINFVSRLSYARPLEWTNCSDCTWTKIVSTCVICPGCASFSVNYQDKVVAVRFGRMEASAPSAAFANTSSVKYARLS